MDYLISALKVWSFISAMSSAGFTQMIMITPQQDDAFCPGDEVFITCETRDSIVLAWTSEEYIGLGTQLEFAIIDYVGTMLLSPVNPNTTATLTKNGFDLNGHEHVLESRLRIIASVNSTVTCINVSNGMTTSIRIRVLANPERPQVTAYQVPSDNNCDLHVHLSRNLLSNNNTAEDISHFTIRINETNTENITAKMNGSSLLMVYRQCSCGSHMINISAVNRCGSLGQSTLTIVEDEFSAQLLANMECQGAGNTTASDGDNSKRQGLLNNVATIIIIVLASVNGLLISLMIVPIICCIIIKQCRGKRERSRNKESSSQKPYYPHQNPVYERPEKNNTTTYRGISSIK